MYYGIWKDTIIYCVLIRLITHILCAIVTQAARRSNGRSSSSMNKRGVDLRINYYDREIQTQTPILI